MKKGWEFSLQRTNNFASNSKGSGSQIDWNQLKKKFMTSRMIIIINLWDEIVGEKSFNF